MTERPAYQQRVYEEADALNDKIAKLQAFLDSPAFEPLEFKASSLLVQQLDTMLVYASILKRRLALFEEKPLV